MFSLSRQLRLLPAIFLGLLAACSSGGKKETTQKPMSDSMASRVMSTDMNKRSSFESAMVRSNSGMGKHLEQRGFGTKAYKSNASYQTPKTLKQETFSGTGDRSRLGRQKFDGSDQQNQFADDAFATSPAQGADQRASQQNQAFSAADETFKTGTVRDAARSQAENKRPLIVKPKGETQDETSYTEDEIRRLVNRR